MNVTTIVVAAVRVGAAVVGVLLVPGQACADAAARPIYRCEVRGQSVFSDRPCGSDASAYEASSGRVSITQSVPVVAAPATESKPAARRRGSAGASDGERARQAAACERIDAGLREIRARMRAGYSAKQGEKLKERQQELQVRRRASRCR